VIAEGGSLGPFGGHKGSGLAYICELLGGALAGEWTMQDEKRQGQITVNNMLMFVLDPDLFEGGAGFRAEVEGMQQYARASRPAEGVDHILLPGDPERETMAARYREGIPIDEGSWDALCASALKAGMTQSEIDAVQADLV
jgi:uncharacterized oxidoreductase